MPANPADSPWKYPERVEMLRELWALKDESGNPMMSASEVTAELNANGFASYEKVTRDATIGKAHRLGLESHKRPATEASIRRRHRREQRYSLRKSQGQIAAIKRPPSEAFEAIEVRGMSKVAKAIAALRPKRLTPFLDPLKCRYPYPWTADDPCPDGFSSVGYCNAEPAWDGCPYCGPHYYWTHKPQ